ncbi:MAG: glycolate oxidase iron-sulfur subunit [Nevskiaceae bacterium]|nr:MAG: glycolate oxidase iron-sulfur subunit [Nevskiaceae bacterium]TBR71630.1 MAG: glycolate oxidase iron-sulfur subunit [Nevskiaceae bacterium]
MQTSLPQSLLDTLEGAEADRILRSCVHCGFCLATCPTYQLTGDELDSPRGRIYQIKEMLEGAPVGASTQLHLDRCLTCRACETTCPSGVEYGQLVDIGRGAIEQRVPRSVQVRAKRWLLRKFLARPRLFGFFLRLGQFFRPLLPRALAATVPARQKPLPALPSGATSTLTRRMLVLEGCVQSVATPNTNAAARRVLASFGIALVSAPQAGCCGALDYHLAAHEAGLDRVRRNIDAWWPDVMAGAQAIVVSASGCGVMVKDYGRLLAHDPAYAEKAVRVAALARDLAEVVAAENRSAWRGLGAGRRIACHAPCTLQHGQKLPGLVEGILRDAGFELTPIADAHLCCGSAGTYSILQPKLSRALRTDKLHALEAGEPELIATANVGCQMHLQAGTSRPVRHWIELFDPSAAG